MTTKTTASVALATSTPVVAVETPKAGDPKVAFCRGFVSKGIHPQTSQANRAPSARASRIAQGLNKTFGHTSAPSGGYWTGADVLALCAREGISLG